MDEVVRALEFCHAHPIMFCHVVVLETRHDLPKKSCRQTPDLASRLHRLQAVWFSIQVRAAGVPYYLV